MVYLINSVVSIIQFVYYSVYIFVILSEDTSLIIHRAFNTSRSSNGTLR